MGLSIKNEEVESLVRAYAEDQGVGVTEAIAHAVVMAKNLERIEKAEFVRKQAVNRYLEISRQHWTSSSAWDRDELHDR